MKRVLLTSLLFILLGSYVFLHQSVWSIREQVRLDAPANYVMPPNFSRVLALGNKGLLADFLFLKTMTYFGGKFGSGTTPSEVDWHYLVESLDVVTDLDPYFVDPYFLAEGLLAWDAGLPEKANRLLEKGMKFRTEDWRLPFFIGFNHFYFLKNDDLASSYIMQAAKLPGSPDYLATLGARLAYYGGKSMPALLFLKQMIADADDPLMRNRLSMRLVALEGAVAIEKALAEFFKQYGEIPKKLSALVEAGFLEVVPKDPYGGDWLLTENGRVFSTSKFVQSR